MENINLITDRFEIKRILYDFDNVFCPKISEIIKDFDEYALKLSKYAKFYNIKLKKEEVGFIAFYINNTTKISYLTLIGIKKEYQNLDYGKKLMNLYEKISKIEKMEILKLEVFNRNEKAINFYKKFGFEILNKTSIETYYMIKNIV